MDNPFNPQMVYKMRCVKGAWLLSPGLALGMVFSSYDDETGELTVHGVRASAGAGGDGAGLALTGKVVADEAGVIDFWDAEKKAEDGSDGVVWRFEPLTLDLLAGMRESVQQYDKLVQQITTDEDLRQFYKVNFLPDGYEDFLK